MLKRALFFRKAIDQFGQNETKYKLCVSPAEWIRVEKVCQLLAPFYEITKLFSGSDYPTSNLYFCNIWKIQKLLKSSQVCIDQDISNMAKKMYKKFSKYWGRYSMILSFAIILDPRFKFDFVSHTLKKLHGEEEGLRLSNEVYLKFVELFKYYENASTGSSSHSASVDMEESSSTVNDDFEDYFASHGAGRGDRRSSMAMTEYQLYFGATIEDHRTPNFDVLNYWSRNVTAYPILSSMARDILAIPITTVASESSFSMGGRILNKWRSSLLSKNVEALVVTRNWLFGYEAGV